MNMYISILSGALLGVIGSLLYYRFFKLLCRYSSCNAVISNPFRLVLLGMVMGAIIGYFILGR